MSPSKRVACHISCTIFLTKDFLYDMEVVLLIYRSKSPLRPKPRVSCRAVVEGEEPDKRARKPITSLLRASNSTESRKKANGLEESDLLGLGSVP